MLARRLEPIRHVKLERVRSACSDVRSSIRRIQADLLLTLPDNAIDGGFAGSQAAPDGVVEHSGEARLGPRAARNPDLDALGGHDPAGQVDRVVDDAEHFHAATVQVQDVLSGV